MNVISSTVQYERLSAKKHTIINDSVRSLKDDMISLSMNHSIPFNDSNILASQILKEFQSLVYNIRGICGNIPMTQNKLSGNLDLIEGETLKIEFNFLYEDVKISWYRDGVQLSFTGNSYIKKRVTSYDSGLYTCQLTNKFGSSSCGQKNVYVHGPLNVIIVPDAIRSYSNDPEESYLFCNSSSDDIMHWYYQSPYASENSFSRYPNDRNYLMVKLSGYYWCIVSNNRETVKSDKVFVRILPVSIATSKISLSMEMIASSNPRSRRSLELDDTHITQDIIRQLGMKKDQIENITINDIAGTSKFNLSFIIKSSSSSTLDKLPWNEIAKEMAKRRASLFNEVVSFYKNLATNNINVTIDQHVLSIDKNSIQSGTMISTCSKGYSILSNGFVCGKSTCLK